MNDDEGTFAAALAGNACYICGSVAHVPDRNGICPREKEVDVPDCGHYRHWDDSIQDDGTGDWETCDVCGRKVCFRIDCPNGWFWDTDMSVVCYRHQPYVCDYHSDGPGWAMCSADMPCTMDPTYKEVSNRE